MRHRNRQLDSPSPLDPRGRRLAFALALALALAACSDPWHGVEPVDSEPVQTNFESYPTWEHRGVMLEAVAAYEIEAVVLSTHGYRWSRFGRVAPMDVALGWGPMSRPEVLRELEIEQRYRWYIYRWRDPPPVPPSEMQAHSANVHVVPATNALRRQLFRLVPGDRVRLVGRLVDIHDDQGGMRTSRSRTDRGDGSCEILYVEELTTL